jgi:hypothetical protein
VSAFADPEIIRMAKEEFVPVAGDDWYQRRRQDSEGQFFMKVANQGGRKGDGTRQGIYFFTADGKLLGFRNHQEADVMRGELKKALAEFKKLPAEQRKPGAIQVGEPEKVDPQFTRKLPKGGIVVNVYTRILDKDDQGAFCHGSCDFTGGDKTAHDHLWLAEEDWKSLVPVNAKKGDSVELPARVALRLMRYHFVDNTRGEPTFWKRAEVRANTLKLTVTDVTPQSVTLKLDGTALMATDVDTSKAKRGFDVAVLATLRYDVASKRLDKFEGVAVGNHWGQGNYTGGARAGRRPLGIAFELATGDSPLDAIPPQAARDWSEYLRADN